MFNNLWQHQLVMLNGFCSSFRVCKHYVVVTKDYKGCDCLIRRRCNGADSYGNSSSVQSSFLVCGDYTSLGQLLLAFILLYTSSVYLVLDSCHETIQSLFELQISTVTLKLGQTMRPVSQI